LNSNPSQHSNHISILVRGTAYKFPVESHPENIKIRYLRAKEFSGEIIPKGGLTFAFLVTPIPGCFTHVLVRGAVAKCHPDDRFRKSTGRELAVQRLKDNWGTDKELRVVLHMPCNMLIRLSPDQPNWDLPSCGPIMQHVMDRLLEESSESYEPHLYFESEL